MEHCYLTISIADGLFAAIAVALFIWILKLMGKIDEREQKISDLEFEIECEKINRKFEKLK